MWCVVGCVCGRYRYVVECDGVGDGVFDEGFGGDGDGEGRVG